MPLTEKCDSVFKIELVDTNEQGETCCVQTGNAFLTDASYVITSCEAIAEAKEETVIQLVVKKDVTIQAKVLTESEEMGFAVLQLEQPVRGREALSFSCAPKVTQAMDIVYCLWDNKTITEGQIFLWEDENEVSSFLHDSIMAGQGSGSPVLNEMGNVIGVNTTLLETGYMQAVNIEEVTAVLDVFGVPYTIAESVPKEEEEQKEGETAEAEDSVSVNAFTQVSAPPALPAKTQSFPAFLWVGIVLFVLLLAGILLLIFRIRAEDKKEKETVAQKPKEEPPQVFKNTQTPFGETTILGVSSPSEETTLLGSQSGWGASAAYLVREKTGEKIDVSKSVFVIGSDGLRSDCCVKDNKSVSRVHAAIHRTNEQFSLEDMHATNGTCVNGKRLNGGERVTLRAGDVLSLANEKFTFYV